MRRKLSSGKGKQRHDPHDWHDSNLRLLNLVSAIYSHVQSRCFAESTYRFALSLSQKKRTVEHDPAVEERIKSLETALLESLSKNPSFNSLADLLDIVQSTRDAQQISKAIYAAYRGDEAARLVKSWLLTQLNTYVEFLTGLLKDEEKIFRTSALQILFSLQKHLSTAYSVYSNSSNLLPQFHLSHFCKIVSALLTCPPSTRCDSDTTSNQSLDFDVGNLLYETWFSVHDDVRWYFLLEAATLLNKHPNHPTLHLNLLSILERLTTFPTEPTELNAWWVAEMGNPPYKRNRSKSHGDALNMEVGESKKKDKKDEDEGSDNDDDDDDWRKYFEEEPVAPEHRAPRYITAPRSSSPRHGLGECMHRLWRGRWFLGAECAFHFDDRLQPDYPSFYTRLSAFLGIPFTYNILMKHPVLMVMIHNNINVEVEYTGDVRPASWDWQRQGSDLL
ncbi:hypothetical protein Agabi119p4_7047 [Agaricus bisporus var. burnettii]|uniref:Uncharacterized protein n=1 Tax=Agaricus bisporus var. burnettii TaxID=192524 RepID=A0A8H7F0N1_AGABI|nr:hypothetical protein Agabi119p4_7047 [Agaricus bisporus var. burnettii]